MAQNSILTDTQREFLRTSESELEEKYTKQQRSYHRQNIRKRIWRALRDFDLLSEEMDGEERRMMLELVNEDSPLPQAGKTDSQFGGAERLFPGVIAFLYQQENNPDEFERTIKEGIELAVEREGWRSDVDVSISIDRKEEISDLEVQHPLEGGIPETMTRQEYNSLIETLQRAGVISDHHHMRMQAIGDKHDFAEE